MIDIMTIVIGGLILWAVGELLLSLIRNEEKTKTEHLIKYYVLVVLLLVLLYS